MAAQPPGNAGSQAPSDNPTYLSGNQQQAPAPGQLPTQAPGGDHAAAPGQWQAPGNAGSQAPSDNPTYLSSNQPQVPAPGQLPTQAPGGDQGAAPGQWQGAGYGQQAPGGSRTPGVEWQYPSGNGERPNSELGQQPPAAPQAPGAEQWQGPGYGQQPQRGPGGGQTMPQAPGDQQQGGWPGPQGHGGATQFQQGQANQHAIQPSLDNVPLKRAKKAPGSGWRKAVHHVSGGAINPGLSAEEMRLQELVARIRQPVRGDYRIAVLSLKGGVGKTTTTMGLGSIFASIRGDRVIAVDANPDFGTLSQRVPLQTRSTVRDLLLDHAIQRYSDVRRHTSQGTSRLEVLASERDPAASEAFNDDEYRAVARILQRFYNIILTDCGTGLMHSAMGGVLDLAHSLVLISSAAIDGARSAAATLDWLSLHGHDHLVRNAVVVINLPREGSPNVGIQQLREYFLSRCRAVHIIPFDNHLSEGAEIDLHRLHKTTKRAYVELAATVADEFGIDHRRYHN
nr:AAA family ATPase [Nocardia australiensis]